MDDAPELFNLIFHRMWPVLKSFFAIPDESRV